MHDLKTSLENVQNGGEREERVGEGQGGAGVVLI